MPLVFAEAAVAAVMEAGVQLRAAPVELAGIQQKLWSLSLSLSILCSLYLNAAPVG